MNIQQFIKDELQIKVRVNKRGDLELNLEDVSLGLGFVNSRDRMVRWDRVIDYVSDIYSLCKKDESPLLVELKQNINRQDQYIPEWIFYMLCMKAKNEKAKKFQLWISKEVLPSLRKNNFYINKNEITKEQREKAIDYLLDLCDCGKISLGKASVKIFGEKSELKKRLVNLGYINFEKCEFKQVEFKASNGKTYPLFVCNMSGTYDEGIAKHQLQVSLTNAGYVWLKDKINKDKDWGVM